MQEPTQADAQRSRVRSVDAGATPRPRSESRVSFSRTNELVELATPDATPAATTPPPADRRLSVDAGVTPRRSRAGVVSFSGHTTSVQLAAGAAAPPAAATPAERRDERQRSLSAGVTPRRSRESVVSFASKAETLPVGAPRDATPEPDSAAEARRRSERAGHTPRHSGAALVSFAVRADTITAAAEATPEPVTLADERQRSLHAGVTPRRSVVGPPSARVTPAEAAPLRATAGGVTFSAAPPTVVAADNGPQWCDEGLDIPEEHTAHLSLHAGVTPNPSRPASPGAEPKRASTQQRTAAEQQPVAGPPASSAPRAPEQTASMRAAAGQPDSLQRQVATALRFASGGGGLGDLAAASICDSALAPGQDRSPWLETPQARISCMPSTMPACLPRRVCCVPSTMQACLPRRVCRMPSKMQACLPQRVCRRPSKMPACLPQRVCRRPSEMSAACTPASPCGRGCAARRLSPCYKRGAARQGPLAH